MRQKQVKKNAAVMCQTFVDMGYKVISGGTDNHLMLIDLRTKNLTGKLAQETLGKAEITINKNAVPFDDKSPFVTSGMRVGTAAITTRGFKETDMVKITQLIDKTLMNHDNDTIIGEVRKEVNKWMEGYPLFKM